MADPLSIAGSAVGIVSLGLQVSQGLITYYSHFKSHDDEIAHITRKSVALQCLLQDLDGPLRKAEDGNRIVPMRVRNSVHACEAGLKRLHAATEKYGNFPVPVTREDKVRAIKKRTLYPFRRAILQDLNNTLEELQANLQLAMNVLIIEMNQSLIEGNVSISEALSTSVQTSQTHLESLSAKVDQMALTLRTCQAQSSLFQEPALLASLCDKQENLGNDTMKFLRAYPRKAKGYHSQYTSDKAFCSCPRRPHTSESRRYLCNSNFSVSWTRTTHHLPNCPRYLYSQRKYTIRATSTYCTAVLAYSLAVAISLTRGAGGLAIAPQLTLRAIVPWDSPAFKLLDWHRWSRNDEVKFACSMDHANWIIKQLHILFQERKAAPTDVLANGSSLLHAMFNQPIRLRNMYYSETYSQFIQTVDYLMSEIMEAGVDLSQRAVITRPHFGVYYERTILDDVVWMLSSKLNGVLDNSRLTDGRMLLARLFDSGLELEQSIVSYPTWVGYPIWMSPAAAATIQQCFKFLGADRGLGVLEVPGILESIFRQDETQLKRILACNPESANQRFCNSITPAHLAVSWPKGLSTLLTIGGDSSSYDFFGLTPLFYALISEQATAVQLLLDHDSGLGSRCAQNDCLDSAFSSKDFNLRRIFISHLINRRQRLLELAFELLPPSELIAMDIKKDRILDAQAARVTSALLRHGINVDPALMPSLDLVKSTVYHTAALDPQIADDLYEAGFRDIDEISNEFNVDGKTPFWYHITLPSFDKPELLQWFRHKGANVYCANPKKKQAPTETSFFDADSSDDCICACSNNGCSAFTSAFNNLCNQSLLYFDIDRQSKTLLTCCSVCDLLEVEITECLWVAFDIIRTMTFERLGLTHTCHIPVRWGPSYRRTFSLEEIHEIQEEERFLIQLHEDLITEFEARFTELGGTLSSFLKEHWKPRMDQVCEEGNKRNEEEEKNMRELGVLIEVQDDEEVGSNSGSKN